MKNEFTMFRQVIHLVPIFKRYKSFSLTFLILLNFYTFHILEVYACAVLSCI